MLVDIGRIPGLSGIREDGDSLRIGAMTRHREFEESPLVRERYPLLADVAKVLGDPQVRNLGTIGGSLAHADPAADWGTALLACDATFEVTGPKGQRDLSADGFFLDPFTTALAPNELLTAIRIPRAARRAGGAYQKLKRKTGDFATVAVAAHLALGSDGTVAAPRLVVGAVGPIPSRSKGAESYLSGKSASEATWEEAARLASEDVRPVPDLHGSTEYKQAMVMILSRRALETAANRARR